MLAFSACKDTILSDMFIMFLYFFVPIRLGPLPLIQHV